MLLWTGNIFDEYVETENAVYTSSMQEGVLSEGKHRAIQVTADVVEGGAPELTVTLQHSNNGRDWTPAPGRPIVDARGLTVGSATTLYGSDTGLVGARCRLAIELRDTTRAHLKISLAIRGRRSIRWEVGDSENTGTHQRAASSAAVDAQAAGLTRSPDERRGNRFTGTGLGPHRAGDFQNPLDECFAASCGLTCGGTCLSASCQGTCGGSCGGTCSDSCTHTCAGSCTQTCAIVSCSGTCGTSCHVQTVGFGRPTGEIYENLPLQELPFFKPIVRGRR